MVKHGGHPGISFLFIDWEKQLEVWALNPICTAVELTAYVLVLGLKNETVREEKRIANILTECRNWDTQMNFLIY